MNNKFFKKSWKIGTVFAVIILMCSFSTAYQVINSSTVTKMISVEKGDADNILDKIKNGENVSWEEMYSFLEIELIEGKNNNWLNSRWLDRLCYWDEVLKLFFGDKLTDVFPYSLNVFYNFLGSPDITEQELLNLGRKILPLHIEMKPAYKALEQVFARDYIPSELPSALKLPSSLEPIVFDIYNKFYSINFSENNDQDLDLYEIDYIEYRDKWELSYELRDGKEPKEWFDNVKFIGEDIFLPWTIGMTLVSIIAGIISEEPAVMFFLLMVEFLVDTLILYRLYQVLLTLTVLTVWDVDIILHVTNSNGTGISGLQVFENNLNASKDDSSGEWGIKMRGDGFYGNIKVTEWGANDGAPDFGWYLLSSSNQPNLPWWYFPPGYWEISIAAVTGDVKYESFTEIIGVRKSERYCLNIILEES